MTTTEAMKQAQHLLRWTHFGECRTYQGPVPEAREVDKLLSEAIATKEAQWVEPVARVKRLTNCSIIDSTGCAVRCEDLPDRSALFTRPAQPPADHIGDATKLAGERAALITQHRARAESAKLRGPNYSPCISADELLELLDMLAADAQKSEPTEQKLPEFFASYEYAPDFSVLVSVYRRRSDALPELVHQESLVAQASIGQQVAAPQIDAVGAALDLEARAKTIESKTAERAMLHAANCLRMLASEPRPPKQIEVPQEPNNDEVICPNCSTQFRAIPVNVQRLLLNSGFNPPFTDVPQPPQADAQAADHVEGERRMVPMTPEQISDTYKKTTGQHLRPRDKHAVETLTREIEAHHKIGVKQ